MAIANITTANGYDPRPGTVHRPTRDLLPPVQGPVLPRAPFAGNEVGVRNHRAFLAPADRTPTSGRFIPATPTVLGALANAGLAKHMTEDRIGGLWIKSETHPAVVACIVRLLARLGINTTAALLVAA
jgi:hypothetical protein